MEPQPRVAFVSTYPPRECGIATFTRDLARALMLRGHVAQNLVVAVNEDHGNRYLDSSVKWTIDQHLRETYATAAGFVNRQNVDIVNLQHEYGIFGGDWGEYVLDLCDKVGKPLVTTLHTVLKKPPKMAREVLTEIASRSAVVAVTVQSAARLLVERYDVAREKVWVVPHGARVPDRIIREDAKRQLGMQGRTILATFGLINPGKGIEYAIRALPDLVKERPDLLYLVVGETHPEVRKHQGEAYRDSLQSLVRRLRLEKHVRFVDRYLQDDELSLYLQAVDVYLAPYLGKEQVSSGTLTLALSHGKAAVATPTTFAKEVLANNRGLFCKFADARSIAECVERIVGDSRLRRRLETNALTFGQEVGWAKVADQYGEIFRSAMGTGRTIDEAAAVSEARSPIRAH